MTAPLWTPSEQQIEHTQMYQFMQNVSQQHNLKLDNYADLHAWSVEQPDVFWQTIWDDNEVISHSAPTATWTPSADVKQVEWFPGSTLNFAENMLRYRDDRDAILFYNEKKQRRSYTYAELYTAVAQFAAGLKQAGIKQGDIVAGFMPNIPETTIAMLATTSLGAIWTSCSPDFGQQGVLDRFAQVKPSLLLTADGYYYNGKTLSSLERVNSFKNALGDVKQTVVVPYIEAEPDISILEGAKLWGEFIDPAATEIEFTPVPFNAPLYIMYSSGTTGQPKCIVHGVGGTLLQHLKEHKLHTDIRREDLLFYYTTCGWMMWNWLMSGLASGCTIMLFDGAPLSPRADYLWEVAEKEGITVFGTSAKYLSAIEKVNVKPAEKYNLSKLRAVLSTGSPLSHESFEYVYRDIHPDILLASISGGTDILSCFSLGCPIRPVYTGELQCKGLGMAVSIYGDEGESLDSGKGELVCEKAFPSMPIGFWNDPEGEKYHSAYFADYENIWAHGDYAERTAQDGIIIHGRSDAVLNPGGVRIGTAEIYRQVEKVEEVMESICIGQPWKDDMRVILFVVLKEGLELNDELKDKIKQVIRANTTPRHVPAKIIQVADIPRTISGKIVEVAVRQMVLGQTVKNRDALANPDALDLFSDIEELQS